MKTYDEAVNQYVQILTEVHANWITTSTINACNLMAFIYVKPYLEVFRDVERINREVVDAKMAT